MGKKSGCIAVYSRDIFCVVATATIASKGYCMADYEGQKEKGQAVKRRKESQGGKDSDNDENG